MYQQYKFKFNTREEDASPMNVFHERNLKLLVDPVKQGISYSKKDESGQKSQCH